MIYFRLNGEVIGYLDYNRPIKKGDVIQIDLTNNSGTGFGKMRLQALEAPVKVLIYGWVVDVKFLPMEA